ncbi:hypothetical protein ACFQ61_15940 [Streptomyces sp. NPDC056500]|uniref:hypothetical protein n=1 Tax=Streptomyces sp. NPDC056500 TaxID=3345840 RepID=UPI0036820917
MAELLPSVRGRLIIAIALQALAAMELLLSPVFLLARIPAGVDSGHRRAVVHRKEIG